MNKRPSYTHRVVLPLSDEKIEKLTKENKLKIILDARRHNYSIHTLLRIKKGIFAVISDKKKQTLIGKKGRHYLAFEYTLIPDQRKQKKIQGTKHEKSKR